MKHLQILLLLTLSFLVKFLTAQCNPGFFKTPDEFVTGRLTGDGNYYGHPYTMFNKRYEGFNVDREIEYIQAQIKYESGLDKKGPVYDAYTAILDEADDPLPPEYATGSTEHFSKLAMWAKYNAFVLLIGVNKEGEPMNTDLYLSNVYKAFEGMKYGSTFNIDKVIVFANTAMCWIQAYDLYKTYKRREAWPEDLPFDYDRNDGDCSIRNKMRTMAFELYRDAWGGIGEWGTVNHPAGYKKNHGIIAASAMLTCAIVLNDAAVRDIRYRWNPKRWFEKANEGIEDCFFKGSHSLSRNVPCTSSDGKAGFNEGPHYWHYTLQTFAPAMLAANNMLSSGHEYNWYNDDRILNICEWFDKIKLQDKQIPTYDDSSLDGGVNVQALIRSYYDYGGTGNMSYHAPDYIVAVCQARKRGVRPVPKETETLTHLDESGNLIFRNTDSKGGKHYFHLLYEPEDAISKEAYNNIPIYGDEGTHDHKDYGSFMIAADGRWLAIDPPYMGSEAGDYIDKYIMHNAVMATKTNGEIAPFEEGYLEEASNTHCRLHMINQDVFGGLFKNTKVISGVTTFEWTKKVKLNVLT